MSDPEESRPSDDDGDDEADHSIIERLRRLAEAFVELIRRLVKIVVSMVRGGVQFFAAKRDLVIPENRPAMVRNRVDEDREQERKRERERKLARERETKQEQKRSRPREVGLSAPPLFRSEMDVGQRATARRARGMHPRIAATDVAPPFRHPVVAPTSKPQALANPPTALPEGVPPFRPDDFRPASKPQAITSQDAATAPRVPPFRVPRPPEQDPLATPNPRPRGMGR